MFVSLTSLLLELALLTLMPLPLPAGPYPLVFALGTLYITQIPITDAISVFGFQISDKVYFYAALFQLLFIRAPGVWVAAASGVVTALLWQYDLLVQKKRLRLPASVQRVGPLVAPAFGITLGTPRVRQPVQRWAPGSQQRHAPPRREEPARAAPAVPISEQYVEELQRMGFSRAQSAYALQIAGNDPQLAANILFDNNN